MSLSIQEAKDLISDVREREITLGRAPETWYTYENHVYGTANVAQTIATHIKGLNPKEIYVSALLHDICKTEENRVQRFHGILGYEKLIDKDEKAARSAIVHMFPWNKISPFEKCFQMFFGNKKDYDFVVAYLNENEATDSDFLIQLADTLANKNGIVTIEQRAQEYAQRNGLNLSSSMIQEMLAPRFELKTYFDKKIGRDVYSLFHHNLPFSRER